MMTLRRYTANDAQQWDAFVEGSRNGTFLFLRPYMDYHSDRFADHSLLFFDEKVTLLALLPANEVTEDDGTRRLFSHQGLTYGGLVLSPHATAATVLQMFGSLLEYARAEKFASIHYKAMPSIYHQCPSEDDEYAIWRTGGVLDQCLISTTIPLMPFCKVEVERRRRRGVTRAQEAGLTIQANAPLQDFWPIMVSNLRSRYDVAPVHTLDEMQLLQQRLPANIRCFIIRDRQGEPLAGAVVYICNRRTVHVQYGHATPEGKQLGALDLLYLSLIDMYRSEGYEFFDFGNSNEQHGLYLNENLIAQKEGFGGRGIAYKTYIFNII
ncbi:MAG: GNAT family N-acetyltransferase [Bacteroidales bacterium]|nr:GNAT family N-acetyltransferase [Candidatus Liminaster caballi]